jgi:hypothetical protein
MGGRGGGTQRTDHHKNISAIWKPCMFKTLMEIIQSVRWVLLMKIKPLMKISGNSSLKWIRNGPTQVGNPTRVKTEGQVESSKLIYLSWIEFFLHACLKRLNHQVRNSRNWYKLLLCKLKLNNLKELHLQLAFILWWDSPLKGLLWSNNL